MYGVVITILAHWSKSSPDVWLKEHTYVVSFDSWKEADAYAEQRNNGTTHRAFTAYIHPMTPDDSI